MIAAEQQNGKSGWATWRSELGKEGNSIC